MATQKARELAAQAWCHPSTSGKTMDVELAEAFAEIIDKIQNERDAWEETAAQNQRNTDYYRGLVTKALEVFGDEAYISDDGSKQQDPLCAKLPELVEKYFRK